MSFSNIERRANALLEECSIDLDPLGLKQSNVDLRLGIVKADSQKALAVVFDLDDVAVGCRLGKAQNGTLIDPGMTGNDAVRLAGSQ